MSMIRKSKLIKRTSLGLLVIPILLLCFLILSCGQDSIFYDISHEPEPKSPLISGNPTNIVLAGNELFVGSRMGSRIFRYGGADGRNPQWSSMPTPEGSLGDLASDGVYLYALVFPNGNPLASSVIHRFNIERNTWDQDYTNGVFSIQTIFGIDGRIFAGAMFREDHQNFAILYLAPNTLFLTPILNNTSLLTGAAGTAEEAYLSTAGAGIFRYSNDSLETRAVSGTEDANITGIIDTGGSIVAVSSNGTVYFRTAQGAFSTFSARFTFTGALSLWADRGNNWNPSLLLAGIRGRGSSIVNGYREIVLDRDGFPTGTVRMPGDETPSSVRNRARYTASIGRHPVEAIMQIPDTSRGGPLDYSVFTSDPDWEPPIFASTSRSGLWSYRNGLWNAEE